MRLINVKGFQLEDFPDESHVQYAVLSHRWQDGEVTFEDVATQQGRMKMTTKHGFHKFEQGCRLAAAAGLSYLWIDTCCIDRRHSAELQEAINSMFDWFAAAKVCFAYLCDVHRTDDSEAFVNSEWFRRGWTLPELLAPIEVHFYDMHWKSVGSRSRFAATVSRSTGVPERVLRSSYKCVEKPYIGEIMSWAADRETTRVEDRAYSLLGFFNVNMQILYGEKEKAFLRLQEEIVRRSEDQSIFAWKGVKDNVPGLLARSPDDFPRHQLTYTQVYSVLRRKATLHTNEGIVIDVDLVSLKPGTYAAILNTAFESIQLNSNDDHAVLVPNMSAKPPIVRPAIFLKRIDEEGRYARIGGQALDMASEIINVSARTNLMSVRRQIIVVDRLYRTKNLERVDPTSLRLTGLPLPNEAIDLCGKVVKLYFDNDGNARMVNTTEDGALY